MKYSTHELFEIEKSVHKSRLENGLWTQLKELCLTRDKPTKRGRHGSAVYKHRRLTEEKQQQSASGIAHHAPGEEAASSAPASEQAAEGCAMPHAMAVKGASITGTNYRFNNRSYSACEHRRRKRIEHKRNGRKKKRDTKRKKKGTDAEFTTILHTKKSISVMYINCWSLWNKEKRAKVAGVARQHKPDVLLIGETWLNDSHTSAAVAIDGYSVIARKDRQTKQKKGGGVLAYAKLGIEATAIQAPDPKEADVVWLTVLSTTGSHLIAGIYRPPGTTYVESYINDVLPDLTRSSTYLSTTLLGDFNDHALHKVYDMSNRLGLKQRVKEPTHSKGNTLDLIFTDNDDAEIEVLKKADIADHLPVVIQIPDDITINEGPMRTFWSYRQADWKGLSKYVKKRTSTRKMKCLSPEAAVNHLDKVINKGMTRYIPSATRKITNSSVPWFDEECYNAMKDSQIGIRSKESYHQLIQEKQRSHMSKMRDTIRRTRMSQKKFWKMAKNLQGSTQDRSSRIPPMKQDGNLITDTRTKCNGFAKAFIAKATLPDGGNFIPRTTEYARFPEFKLTRQDVLKWLKKLNPDKASGPNAISPKVYKKISRAISEPIYAIYKRMLQLGVWPNQWKHSAICPIYKRKDPATYTNYRPISLIDVLSKILERNIARHITKNIIQNGYLPEKQYGFRPQHSCSDLAMNVIGQAILSVNERKPFYLLQTDIAGAFDRVDRDHLVKRLTEAGVPPQLHRLLTNYLTERTFHVRVSGARSEIHHLDVGVVQGSGLGPVMWNIFFTPIFDATKDLSIGFADDLNLITQDQNELEAGKRRMMAACEASRITVEPTKEVLTIFYPPRYPNSDEQATTRLVGVLVDPKLNMEDHISHVLSKARIAKTKLMRMRPYCTQDQIAALYKTLIWSALEYGSVCYAHASEVQLRKIDAFQTSTLRMLGLTDLDTMATRRRTAHATMIYKQAVLNRGPRTIPTMFPAAPPDPRAHLRRTSTSSHPHQINIKRKRSDLKIYEQFCAQFKNYNQLNENCFPSTNSLAQFKRNVATIFRSDDSL